MSNQMTDEKFEAKLRKIINEGKSKMLHVMVKGFTFRQRKFMILEKKKKMEESYLLFLLLLEL